MVSNSLQPTLSFNNAATSDHPLRKDILSLYNLHKQSQLQNSVWAGPFGENISISLEKLFCYTFKMVDQQSSYRNQPDLYAADFLLGLLQEASAPVSVLHWDTDSHQSQQQEKEKEQVFPTPSVECAQESDRACLPALKQEQVDPESGRRTPPEDRHHEVFTKKIPADVVYSVRGVSCRIGKPWMAPLNPNYIPQGEFWGGCELADLVEADDDQKMEVNLKTEDTEPGAVPEDAEQTKDKEEEEDAADDDDDGDDDSDDDSDDDMKEEEVSSLPGKSIGLFRCTATMCSWYTRVKGQKGMHALQSHVNKCHTNVADELWPVLLKKYDMNHRQYKTQRAFQCSVCGKTKRGSKAHERRHKESCEARHEKKRLLTNKITKKKRS